MFDNVPSGMRRFLSGMYCFLTGIMCFVIFLVLATLKGFGVLLLSWASILGVLAVAVALLYVSTLKNAP